MTLNQSIELAVDIYWRTLLSFLLEHWLVIIVSLVVILAIASFRAISGRWGMLGSVLYNYLYFGILFVIGLLLGPGVFVSNFFSLACTIILYPFCYFMVGRILAMLGLTRKR